MNAANDLDTPTVQREYKAFATMAAQYAMHGYSLIKGDPAIAGQSAYYVTRWGALVQPLADLEAACDHLAAISRTGGAGHGQKLQSQ